MVVIARQLQRLKERKFLNQNIGNHWYKKYEEVKDKKTGETKIYEHYYTENTSPLTKTITDESYTYGSDVYYDVPKSDFYVLKEGEIGTKHVKYEDFLESGLIQNKESSVPNPGTRSITVEAHRERIKLLDPLEIDYGVFETKEKAEDFLNSKGKGDASGVVNGYLKEAEYINCSEFTDTWISPDGGETQVTATSASVKKWTPSSIDLKKDKELIDPTNHHNGNYTYGSGYVRYDGVSQDFPIRNVNKVIVHTPVVNNSKVVPAKFKNQLFKQNANTTYLQLDADFEVFIPRDATSELCIDKKGYRARPYNSYQGKAVGSNIINQTDNKTTWGKIKDVQIPFDTYFINSDGKKTFVPGGKWLSDVIKDSNELLNHDSPKGGDNPGVTYKFTVPVWVEEKEYTIKTRVIAENADDNCISFEENGVNKSTDHYVATKEIPVEVIGKIYDLEVINYSDPNWKDIMGFTSNGAGLNRNNKEQTLGKITAEQFPAGTRTGIYKYKSGKILVYSGPANQNKDTLHNLAPKLGYTFTFSLKTKGRKSNNLDIKVANDGFRFVKKNPGKDSPAKVVDLYYKPAGSNMYVRIGDQANDKAELYAAINEGFFKSSELEKANSLRLYPAEKIAGSKYIPNSQPIVPYNYSQRVKFGRFYNLDIPHYFRLAFDNISEYATVGNNKGLYLRDEASIYSNADISKYAGEANKDFVTGSVGHWYIAYTLPVSTVAVPAGENPNSNPSKILKGGYIIVTFDIMSRYEDKDGNKSEYLIYTGPEVDFSSDCMEQEELHIEWNYVINSTGITSTRGGIGRKNNSSGNPKLSSNNSPINNPIKVGNDTLNKNVVTLAELQNLERTNNAKELEQLGYYRQATMMDGTNTYIPLRSVAAYETDYTAAKDDAIVGGTH